VTRVVACDVVSRIRDASKARHMMVFRRN